MFLDCHMHIGKMYQKKNAMTSRDVLKVMDKKEINRAFLLPIESPEECDYYVTTDYILAICQKYPKRFIPFCNIDPRIGYWGDEYPEMKTDFYGILAKRKEQGCKGYGEAMAGLYIDDPRLQEIYRALGKLKMPIIYHMDGMRNIDEIGLPRFEKILKRFPQTIFIGHANHFWNEISADIPRNSDGLNGYNKGPIKKTGRLIKLLSKYPNLYADLSANSGYNALTRDTEFGYWFLTTFADRLFFGTDMTDCNAELPLGDYLKEALAGGHIRVKVFEKIAYKNAERVFGVNNLD